MALKIIFMGTPDFAVPILNTLIESEHHILQVYTQTPKKSKRGQKINLSPVHEFSNKNKIIVRSPEQFNDLEIDNIKKLSPDVVVVVAYGKMIPSKALSIKNINFINIHASLLPRWRGAAPIQRSIIEMDKETGISIMKIVPELDAGPYMLQEKIDIEIDDNYTSLSKKLSTLSSKLIIQALKLIETNSENFKEQDKNLVTYAKKVEKTESKIFWGLEAKKLIAKINGLNPVPGVWFEHKGSRFKIIKAVESELTGKEGEILDDNLTIACKNNSIRIISIQKEGKKILNTKSFLSGYKLSRGEFLS